MYLRKMFYRKPSYFCIKHEEKNMKRNIVIILTVLFCLFHVMLSAQHKEQLFLPYTWEQASLIAARENKLVMIEFGEVASGVRQKILRQPDLVSYLCRNVVAIQMDAGTPEGQEFLPRLLMFDPPRYAFFMPYGDLVGSISPEEVGQRGEALRETLQQAREKAERKKRNSRSVSFLEAGLKQAAEKAAKEDKLIFAYLPFDHCQACLLIEKDVFTLDSVADFFNKNFVNIRLTAGQAPLFLKDNEVSDKPVFLFFNGKGKVVYRAGGFCQGEQLVGYGKTAFKKAEGISFRQLSTAEARVLAGEQGKMIFYDHYRNGNVHQELLRTVFADPDVAECFEQNFINVAVEGDESMLVFTDASGKELHRVKEVENAEELLAEAQLVITGKGLSAMDEDYLRGERVPAFLREYIGRLYNAGRKRDASDVAVRYLLTLPEDCLKEETNWELFRQYVLNAHSNIFDYVLAHRQELAALYGAEPVQQKIAEIWIAGAEDFVQEGEFDEVAFKVYTKRLKQEKVEGWRNIVRNARMNAAEKTADWTTYVTLAEEKWNEETISDAELYRWGTIINQKCQDEAIRYKAARWFAEEALAMERRERQSGKVKLNSYKGFFEKLVDDLIGKK